MASNDIEYRRQRKALNLQNDKVRQRLFDISLVISNGIMNKTISNYAASKYLQEVRKYKMSHLWDNQVTEMSEKLITQLKMLTHGTYMCFHNYNTRLSNKEYESDSSEETFETIDDMIDHYSQDNDYKINPKPTGKRNVRSNKKTMKETKKIKKKSRKGNNVRKGRKAQSFINKIKDDNKKIDVLHTIDFQNMLGIKNNINDNAINKNVNDTDFPNKPKFSKTTYADASKSNGCAEFNRCLNKEEEYENSDGIEFAIDLSLKPKNAHTSTTNTLFDIQYPDQFNQCRPVNEQHVGNNEKSSVLNLSLYQQQTADLNESETLNEKNVDNKKDGELSSLHLFSNSKRFSETDGMTYFENSEFSSKENKIILQTDVDYTMISNTENHFCNQPSLPVSKISEEKDNTKTLIPKTRKTLGRQTKDKKKFNEEVVLKNTKGIEKRGRKKKNISNDPQTMAPKRDNEKTNATSKNTKDIKKRGRKKKNISNGPKSMALKRDNEKTNATVNTNINSNDPFCWIRSIECIRQIDEDEYSIDLEVPDEFWNNLDLPPDWNENDFNL